jgi:hypothetical protein
LFRVRIARVTAAESSSREEKRCPRMGCFNLGNSPSLVDSCVDCMAREVPLPTRIYSRNWSQPSPGAGVHCRAKWVAHPRASQVGFCAFLCAIFAWSHDNTLLSHLFHMELCHDDFSVITGKNHHLLDIWLRSSKFFGSRGGWTSPLLWLRFQLQFKAPNPRFVNSDNSMQECLTFNIKSLLQ